MLSHFRKLLVWCQFVSFLNTCVLRLVIESKYTSKYCFLDSQDGQALGIPYCDSNAFITFLHCLTSCLFYE